MEPSRTQRRQMQERAREWRQFRADHLFTQRLLADELHIGKRTVCNIEGESVVTPRVRVLRAFRELKRRLEDEERQRAQLATRRYKINRTPEYIARLHHNTPDANQLEQQPDGLPGT